MKGSFGQWHWADDHRPSSAVPKLKLQHQLAALRRGCGQLELEYQVSTRSARKPQLRRRSGSSADLSATSLHSSQRWSLDVPLLIIDVIVFIVVFNSPLIRLSSALWWIRGRTSSTSAPSTFTLRGSSLLKRLAILWNKHQFLEH